MHSNFDHWVKAAIRCFENDGSLKNENIFKFEKLLQLIVEEWNIRNDTFSASDDVISEKVRSILKDARNKSNSVQYVHQSKGQLQKELGVKPLTTYTITFPLNLSFLNWDNPPKQFTVRERTIQKINSNDWKRRYWSSIAGRHNIVQFLRKSPNDLPSLDVTYWRCRIDAIDERYAVNRVTDLVELLCSKINFSINYRRSPWIYSSNGPWPHRWSELRSPFIYFVFKEGIHLGFYKNEIYESYFYSNDPTFRDEVEVKDHRIKRTNDIMEILPILPEKSNNIDQLLIDGLMRYQRALTETDSHEAFLNYWRGIETMTLTNKSERMSEIPKRAGSLFRPDNPDMFEYRLYRVKTLRNELVHEGQNPRIQDEDLKLLKTTLEELIWLFIEFREDRDFNDFNFILNEGGNDKYN